jgi:LuxR family maltose regulon positive regulatory protein
LISQWLAGDARPAAWLSLDEGENDSTRFLTYLVAALQTIVATIGAEMLGALQSSQPPPLEAILTTLVNELITISDSFVLVLDDYHVLEAKQVDHIVAFLLERLPPQMHLVIATREDPRLPLARLRARGQLTEVRAADLRCTPAEAAAFLTQVMGLSLAPEDVTALEFRTEGWIAGLQLAALSLQGQQDAAGFIRTFAGDHRYIVDYLVDEVLERQPEHVRSFLLQTAVLDQMTGSLCDAITGQGGGAAQLEALERGAYFVVALDEQRRWYRYHHLFADVLHARLLAERPDQVARLHRRASEWYEQQGLAAEAIRHALAAEDFARAADLIELAVPAMRRSRGETIVLGWLRALPHELVRQRPMLSVAYAWVLLACGKFDAVDGHLRDAEGWLEASAQDDAHMLAHSPETVVVDAEEVRRLPALIAVYRAVYAQAQGDLDLTVEFARRALDLVPADDYLAHGAAAALLGLASWAGGDLETARQTYADGMTRLRQAGHLSDALGGAIALADILVAQGRLREAMSAYEQAMELATERGGRLREPVLRGAADVFVGMSELHREWNDLQAAQQCLQRSEDLGEHTGLPQNHYRWYVAMARVREAQGDLDGALDLLHDAERRYVEDLFPNVRPISAMRARVWIAQGKVGEALSWARKRNVSAQDDLRYLREYEHVTLARALLAQHKSDQTDRPLREAMDLLERLLNAAEAGGRTGAVIEILALQSLAYQAHGDIPTAVVRLGRALTPAEPESYLRIFADEGPPMASLLQHAAKHGLARNYVGQLLTVIGSAEDKTPPNQGLIEPLSERELDVLRLLGSDLDGPGIARELTVSLNTVRTHTKNIYSKLGVNNRRAAVRRAVELALLSRAWGY